MSDLQEGRYPNRLITTSSPYLLQHAYNPVDWFPWGAEALARAKREDRPILVSIGYATCHWCHVMERESFEDEGTALLMNREFICIKVDREERPDLDQVYMEAVQMITGSGGWPLNCFLTPDGRPFYGGTYFPPEPMGQRPSWTQVLSHMANLYREKRSVIETQADRLTAAIRDNQTRHLPSGLGPEAGGEGPDPTAFRDLVDAVMAERDARDGGFGPAPKFPRTMSMELLLAWSARTGEAGPADHVGFSLHKMIRGGIYDQIGGGLARYSTDKAWLVPHFEKMLYDQALFVDLLSKWIRYRPDPVAESAIRETLQFIEEHLTHPEGAFYAAIDADSEGVEGKYYVWQAEEFDRVVGKDAALWRDYLGVRVGGNWEGTNVLHRPEADPEFASRYGMSMEVLRQKWPKVRARLAVARSTRVPPIRDDKVILSWNALMIEALVSAYRALEEPLYLDRARRALRFIDRYLRRQDGGYDRIYAGDRSYQPAFLDDQAFLLRARIRFLEVGSDEGAWHGLETELQQIQNRFYDPERKAYLSSETSGPAGPMIDVLDSALPSGQAVMLEVLDLATSWSGDTRWSRLAEDLRHRLWPSIRKYPSSFAQSALSVLDAVWGRREIAVIGDQAGERLREVLKPYLPGTLVVASGSPSDLSILDGRYVSGKTYLYLCTDRSCRAPVETLDELLRP